MKKRDPHNIAIGLVLGVTVVLCVAAGTTPILNGLLQGNLDGGGFSITNAVFAGDGSSLTNLPAEADTLQTVVTRGGTVTNGIVTIDSANARTNTYGGALTVLGERVQEGTNTTASGNYSHAEGRDTTAGGYASHSEGFAAEATGNYSHSEGRDTLASGSASHAEGWDTTASGNYSHAAGRNATASDDYTYVWADGTATASSTTKQYTVYAENGIRLLGAAGVEVDGNLTLSSTNALQMGGIYYDTLTDTWRQVSDDDFISDQIFRYLYGNTSGEGVHWGDSQLDNDAISGLSVAGVVLDWSSLYLDGPWLSYNEASNGYQIVNYQTMVAYEWVTAPASNTAAGEEGQKAYDDNYLYICVSNATWRRTVIASW